MSQPQRRRRNRLGIALSLYKGRQRRWPMAVEQGVFARRLLLGGAVLLLAVTCIGLSPRELALAAAEYWGGVAPLPPGMARIWIYRDYEPYQTLARPCVRVNGAIVGI